MPHESIPTSDQFIAEKRIGERIRRLRLKKSMGLVELGRHTSLSASFLSQLETGRVVPTLRNLARIAMVFSKDLSYFFEDEPKTIFHIHKKNDRVRLPQYGSPDPSFYFESLGYEVPDRVMDPYWAEFVPIRKKKQQLQPHTHPGFEFLYLSEGEIQFQHGEHSETLLAGDAIYFDATTPHVYKCLGKKSAKALIVTVPQMIRPSASAIQVDQSVGRTNQTATKSQSSKKSSSRFKARKS